MQSTKSEYGLPYVGVTSLQFLLFDSDYGFVKSKKQIIIKLGGNPINDMYTNMANSS